MKRFFTIIFILYISFTSAQAQKYPGIMGKHLSLGYRPSFSFAISGLNSGGRYMNIIENRELGKAVPLAFNITHSFLLNYILNRRLSLVVNINMMKSIIEIDQYQDYNSMAGGTITKPLLSKTSGYGFLVGIRKYASDIPVGWFGAYKIGVNMYSANIDYSYQTYNGSNIVSTPKTITVKQTNFRFIYELGKQFILKERLLLDISVEVDWYGVVLAAINREPPSIDNYEKLCKYSLKKRSIYRDLTGVNFGINYLLK